MQNYKLYTYLKVCIWNNFLVWELKVTKIISKDRENFSTYCTITEIFKVKAYLWCYTCYFNSDKCPRLCQVHRTHLTNKNIFVHVTFYMYIFRTWGYHHCNPLIFYIPVHILHVHVTCVLQVLWIITHMALTRLLLLYRNLS